MLRMLARFKRAIVSQNYLFKCGGAIHIREHAELVLSEKTCELEKAMNRIESNPVTLY
jgi:hypothetical protein